MQQVVGGAAGGVQADDAVDDRALVDDVTHRQVAFAQGAVGGHPVHRSGGQRIAQRGVRRLEAGTRQVQAHDLHQHLVGVGGAIEGAGAGGMVGRARTATAACRGVPG
jgi:hypothetical protein